uniref:Predicted protein n=1 Tax=Physcomitrium patens TaxID=3218 RepID=A9U4F3_PHYPA
MESQQPGDSTQEPSFADLPDETLRLSQPSRRRNRDEDLQERHVLPRTDGEIQRVWYHDLGRDSRCLVILLEVGTTPDVAIVWSSDMDSQEIDTMLVRLSQPTSSRKRSRDEEPPAPRRRQRIPSNRSLVIVFESEPAYNGQPEVYLQDNFTMKTRKFMLGQKLKEWATTVGFKGR